MATRWLNTILQTNKMWDRSLNFRHEGEVDNRLRITQPHSQALPERRGSGEGGMTGKAKHGGRRFSQRQAKEVGVMSSCFAFAFI
jgi:hypothetical protein